VTLSQLQIISATDGAGTNCQDRTLCALSICHTARAVIGTLIVRDCRDLRNGRPIPWAKPWGHHIWLIEQDGVQYDPSAGNLAHWAREQEVQLPRPWQQITAGVVDSQREQARIVAQTIGGHPTAASLPEAVYLPGLVYSSGVEEHPQSPAYVTAWGRLAAESAKAGGWDAAQLSEALGRVDSLMAEPPQIRSTPVPMKRSGRGFARELA
jgi:hypothetical protein